MAARYRQVHSIRLAGGCRRRALAPRRAARRPSRRARWTRPDQMYRARSHPHLAVSDGMDITLGFQKAWVGVGEYIRNKQISYIYSRPIASLSLPRPIFSYAHHIEVAPSFHHLVCSLHFLACPPAHNSGLPIDNLDGFVHLHALVNGHQEAVPADI